MSLHETDSMFSTARQLHDVSVKVIVCFNPTHTRTTARGTVVKPETAAVVHAEPVPHRPAAGLRHRRRHLLVLRQLRGGVHVPRGNHDAAHPLEVQLC